MNGLGCRSCRTNGRGHGEVVGAVERLSEGVERASMTFREDLVSIQCGLRALKLL